MAAEKITQPSPARVAPSGDSLPSITPSTTTSSANEKKGPIGVEINRTLSMSSSNTSVRENPFDTDVEAIAGAQSVDNLNQTTTRGTNAGKPDPNCTIWPGQDHWRQRAKAAKMKNRSCQCMAGYSKRTRLFIKIGLILLVVAIGVGVGFGVSKPLGAGIWDPDDGYQVNN